MATAKKAAPSAKKDEIKDVHLTVPDKGERKRAAQSVMINDPLLLPYAIQVKKGKFDVVKPFTIKSGPSKDNVINYVQTTKDRLCDAVAWIMTQRNSLPEGKITKNETVTLEGFLAKIDTRSKEIGQLLLKFNKTWEERDPK